MHCRGTGLLPCLGGACRFPVAELQWCRLGCCLGARGSMPVWGLLPISGGAACAASTSPCCVSLPQHLTPLWCQAPQVYPMGPAMPKKGGNAWALRDSYACTLVADTRFLQLLLLLSSHLPAGLPAKSHSVRLPCPPACPHPADCQRGRLLYPASRPSQRVGAGAARGADHNHLEG